MLKLLLSLPTIAAIAHSVTSASAPIDMIPGRAADALTKACYAYVSSGGTSKERPKTNYYTHVFTYSVQTQDCWTVKMQIQNDFADAFRASMGEYPEDLATSIIPFIFESRGAAERARTQAMGESRANDFTVHTFVDFSFYPED